MKYLVLFMLTLAYISAQNKYLDNHSCNECHEKIYEEYQSSFHAKSYFNDELHRKIADKVSTKQYDCAVCHMPMADNLQDLMTGKARPNKSNKTHTDAVSCYFCHTIAYVKNAHKYNINLKARQAKNYKPTLYGRLVNPDDSDKHSSVANPVYGKKVCMGCHSHKLNENNVTIFRAMGEKQDSIGCIECHMPEVAGGAEKMDKRTRGHHASHKFLGIHDVAFRKTGVDINLSIEGGDLHVLMENKMEHPLIVQPARAKYLKIEISRGNELLWRNYQTDPSEDKQGYFAYRFKKAEHAVVIPATATESSVYNLETKETKRLIYTIPKLEALDKVSLQFMVQFGKTDCAGVVNLSESNITKPELIKEVIFIQK